jgi:hypothetical protein
VNGVATVSTDGALTEPVWRTTGAAALVPQGEVNATVAQIRRLLDDRGIRAGQGQRGLDVYRSQFALELTIARLREPAALPVPA